MGTVKSLSPPSSVDMSAPQYLSDQVESSRLFWFDPADAGCEVISGGYECCRPDYRIDRDGFEFPTFEFVAGGVGSLQLAGRKVTLRPGVAFLHGPGIRHRIDTDPLHPLRKYFVVFRAAPFSEDLKVLDLAPGMAMESTRVDAMRQALDEMIERGGRRTRWSQRLCGLLLRQVLTMAREDALDAGLADTRAFRTFRRVRDFIERHHLELNTLDAIAKSCDLDAAYLCRLFTRFQDETPYQCLVRLRMEHAARRLLETEMSVREVSEELEYSDPFHFSRVFKSVHRVPPSRFRKGGRSQ